MFLITLLFNVSKIELILWTSITVVFFREVMPLGFGDSGKNFSGCLLFGKIVFRENGREPPREALIGARLQAKCPFAPSFGTALCTFDFLTWKTFVYFTSVDFCFLTSAKNVEVDELFQFFNTFCAIIWYALYEPFVDSFSRDHVLYFDP